MVSIDAAILSISAIIDIARSYRNARVKGRKSRSGWKNVSKFLASLREITR